MEEKAELVAGVTREIALVEQDVMVGAMEVAGQEVGTQVNRECCIDSLTIARIE